MEKSNFCSSSRNLYEKWHFNKIGVFFWSHVSYAITSFWRSKSTSAFHKKNRLFPNPHTNIQKFKSNYDTDKKGNPSNVHSRDSEKKSSVLCEGKRAIFIKGNEKRYVQFHTQIYTEWKFPIGCRFVCVEIFFSKFKRASSNFGVGVIRDPHLRSVWVHLELLSSTSFERFSSFSDSV